MLQKGTTSSAVIRGVTTFALLLLFLSAQWQQWAQHRVHHGHEHAAQHTDADEQDACHRNIFHHDTTNGCAHPAHITAPHLHCDLCDYLCVPVLWYHAPFALAQRSTPHQAVFSASHLALTIRQHQPDARGPPCLG
jgi:hypothetical protein